MTAGDNEGPVLDQINLVVADMKATAAFYERLGVTVPAPPAPWSDDHRTATTGRGLDFDLDSSSFAAQWNEGWLAGKTGVVIGFRLPTRDAVDATHADLVEAGYVSQQAPYDAFWGARYAVMEDPDGNSVGLMSPMDPAMRAAPPDPPA